MTVRGTVVHQDIEGGFWGILADDGSKYHPVGGLPHAYREDGCRIMADIEPVEAVTFAMWGRNVRIRNIKRI